MKIYVETTIPSYLVSRHSRDIIVLAHQQITEEWWEEKRKQFDLYVSTVVLDEISAGDETLAKKRYDLIKGIPSLELMPDTEKLARIYLKELNLPNKALRDSLHIAMAVGHEMDYILTWNCAHIANEQIRRKLQEINSKIGKKTPLICTPEELI